ncbi:MAG: zf-HC2 domain-containing protein [Desulfatiglandaceae bacterium]
MKASCRKYFQRISEYLDGELDVDICEKIEAHLDRCPECRECLDSLRRTIALCKKAAAEEIPAEASQRLHMKIKEFLGSDSM